MKRLVYSIFILLFVSTFGFAVEYQIIDLGTLGGQNSKAYSINDQGQIVGTSKVKPRYGDYYHAFLYENGTMVDIGTSIPGESGAVAINNNSQIICKNSFRDAFLYENNNTSNLGYWEPTAMNNNGVAVGYHYSYGEALIDLYNGSVTTLSNIYQCEPKAINNNGVIVGTYFGEQYADPSLHKGFIYDNGNISYFGTSMGNHVYPYGINDNGQIVGTCGGKAFLYENGMMIDLEILSGHAWDINNKGQIVGYGLNGNKTAFIYENGQTFFLPCLNGHYAAEALSINENGWIVGTSYQDSSTWHAVLWVPVPEPTTIGLLSVGLFILKLKSKGNKNGKS